MSIRLLRYVLASLLLACGLFHPAPAHATISCSQTSMTNVSFGVVDPQSSNTAVTAVLSYACTNSNVGNGTRSATVCFSIGEPGGAQTNPRVMTSATGGNKLQFQLWQDAGHTIIWGSQFFGSPTPAQVNITLAKGASTQNATITLYGQVLGNQNTAAAGSYSDVYATGDTAVTVNEVSGSTAPGSCSGTQTGNYFPFTVSATIQKACTVTANNVSLGAVAAGAGSTSGSNTLSVTCTNATPYYVGLKPSNGNTAGKGVMKGQSPGNQDTVPYTLYSNSGLSTIWGNTATSTSVGNGAAGTGNGLSQTLTVYAQATSTDVTPDTYSDTVQVNVNY